MSKNIETTETRVSPVKKAVVAIGLTASLATSALTGDYYLVDSITIANEKYTKHEYSQIKPLLIEKFENRHVNGLSFAEFQAWASVANREVKQCGTAMTAKGEKGVAIENIVGKNLDKVYEEINRVIKLGC